MKQAPLATEHAQSAYLAPRQQRALVLFTVLLAALPACLMAALTYGVIDIALLDVIAALRCDQQLDRQTAAIVLDLRLPRALLAMCCGAVLALTGAATQGLFRNPLADPSLIGVTAGAAIGASLCIVVFGSATLAGALPLSSLAAFAGGALTVWLVYRLASNAQGTSVATMLLAGIAITALAASITGFLEYLSDDSTLRRLSMWRMGGFDSARWSEVGLLAAVAALLAVGFWHYAPALNALLLGESEARHLGVDVASLKRWLIALVAIGVGVSVATAGMIGFVGLVVPHLARMLLGPDHRLLLPASALLGACLMLLADLAARLLLAPAELPVGLVTAFIGAPFFIAVLLRRRDYSF